MRRLFFGLVLLFTSCGDSPTLTVETPRVSRVYGRDARRAPPEERYVMQVGQIGTASCYLDVDRDDACGPATFERCLGFEISTDAPHVEVMKVVQLVGEPNRVAFIAREAGSAQLVLRAEGIQKSLLVEVREPPEP